MYFHLVCSAEFFSNAPGVKSTQEVFRQVTELMVAIDHEFLGNPTSLPFPFLSFPCQMGIWLSLQKRLTRINWAMEGCQRPNFLSCANANFVYL